MEPESRKILVEGAARFGIRLDESALIAFDLFLGELQKWNRKINLTAIRTERDVVIKHFLDSLSLYPCLPKTGALVDLGSGAGFPGIPLKIIQPSYDVTLIDSVLKKVDFQRHICRTLGLKGITAIHGRLQDREIVDRLEETFDVALSRALADPRTFLDLSYPFLKKGGVALWMKGKVEEQDLQTLVSETRARYRTRERVSFVLPFSSMNRSIILFEKA